MKTRLLIIGTLLGGMICHSCYKDLGNYDYREINEVIIGEAGFIDTTYKYVSFVDTLRISPQVENTIIQYPDNYEFRWFLNDENTEIGREKDLVWPVNRPEGGYRLFFRIKDKSTGVVVTRSVNVNLTTNFSNGWLVWGENENGEAQLDMLAFVNGDTVLMKDILNGLDMPVLKKPTFLFLPITFLGDNAIQLGSEDGTYKLDKNSLTPIEDAHLKYSFWDPSSVGSCVLQHANQMMYFRVETIDGNLYFDNDRMGGYRKMGNPSNHYKGNYELFKMGNKVGFDFSSMTSSIIVVYDDDNKCFLYQGHYMPTTGGVNGYCAPIPNIIVNDDFWTPGKDFVTTINSRNVMISNYTILKNPGASSPSDYYLYPYKINASFFGVEFTHRDPQQLTNAEDIDKAEFFACSSRKTVIFYTVGSRLYGYDYSTARGKLLLDFGGEDRVMDNGLPVTEVITAIWNEQYIMGMSPFGDEFYIGLYDPAKPASTAGRLVGYRVVDNPNDIVIEEIPGTSRKGLCKIASVAYKS